MVHPSDYVISGALVANVLTFVSFRADKRAAIAGEFRIAERDLLLLAALGGSPSAIIARQLFRHKTRKEPFSTYLWVIFALQLGAIIGWIVASN